MFVGVLLILGISLASIQSVQSIKKRNVNQEGNGPVLILTPYIENGELDEARRMSEVKSDIFLGVKSYSGFLTVNKTYNSNLFFWYFPIENEIASENPLIIWLQGGPGFSSLNGVFEEIGPFSLDKDSKVIRNPHSLHQTHSLVFIDNPIGAGYSYTDDAKGVIRNMETYTLHLKLAALQLLQLFPELNEAPLFVAGESYGGKYAPALAMELHKAKESGLKVNLQGIITGNGYVDPSTLVHNSVEFYHFGFLAPEDTKVMEPLVNKFKEFVQLNLSYAAYNIWAKIFASYQELTELNVYNYNKDVQLLDPYTKILNQSEVIRAIHVGDIEFSSFNMTVLYFLEADFLTSARHLYEELLENDYKVLAYCGMLDLVLPCYLESEEYRKWHWRSRGDFISAPRNILYFNDTQSGYYKSSDSLTEIQISNAGHFAAMDTPALLQYQISAWTNDFTPSGEWVLDCA